MSEMPDTAALKQQFGEIFDGARPAVAVRSPGRVNLIGEHTDYNDGFVMPLAMSQGMMVLAGKSDSRQIEVHSTSFDETLTFSAEEPGPPDDAGFEAGTGNWGQYVRGMAAMFRQEGVELQGGRLLIDSDVPIGGGVSSSAALEIGSGLAMLALSMYTLEAPRVAQLAQMAEHKYAHSPCGIMDQFICILGKPNQALLLDCRSLEHQYVPLPADGCTLMVMNTQVKHSIGGGEYPVRVKQCKEGVGILQKGDPSIKALRDANLDILETHRGEMDDVVYRRCRHVITEIDRCQQAGQALSNGDLTTFGQLMYGSHYSLRDDYEVSCDELDALVEVAAQVDGVYGSRMTGGGFGGCAIALIRADAEEALRAAIAEKYDGRFEKPAVVYTTQASAGAEILPA